MICRDEVVEIFWASSRAALIWSSAKEESDMGAGSRHLPFKLNMAKRRTGGERILSTLTLPANFIKRGI